MAKLFKLLERHVDSLYPDDIKTFTFWLFLMFYLCSRSTG